MELLRHKILERQATSIDVRAVERYVQYQQQPESNEEEFPSSLKKNTVVQSSSSSNPVIMDLSRYPHGTKPTRTPKPGNNEELVGNKDALVDERINRSTSVQTVGTSVLDDLDDDIDDLPDLDENDFEDGGKRNNIPKEQEDYSYSLADDNNNNKNRRSHLAAYGTPRRSNFTDNPVTPRDTVITNNNSNNNNPLLSNDTTPFPPRQSTNLSTALMMNNIVDPNITMTQMIDAYLMEDDELDDDYGLTAVEAMIEAQKRIDASWSEPFLRTCLNIIRNSRRSVMSSMKLTELKNREHAVEDIKSFIQGIPTSDKRNLMLGQASRTGLV